MSAARLRAAVPRRVWGPEPTAAGALATLPALAALWWLGGTAGVAAWTVLAVVWLLLPTVVAAAVGQVAVVALVDPGPLSAPTVAAEGALALLVLAALADLDAPLRTGAVGGVAAVLLGGLALVAVDAGPPAAALAVVLAAAGGSYLLHRYALVALGLVGDDVDGAERGTEA